MKTKLITAGIALVGAMLNAAPANWLTEKPEARWIWTEQSSNGQQLFFRRTFEVRGAVKSAQVYATCDNRLKLWINGRLVGESPDWPEPVERDVTRFMVPGRNVIAAAGQNAGGVAAFVLKLAVEQADGAKLIVATDKSWKLSGTAGKGWEAAEFDDAGWQSGVAYDRGALGVGPWGIPKHVSASGRRQSSPLDPENIRRPDGFEVDLVHAVSKEEEGSWVSLTVDPQGRFYASDQAGKGLFRITVGAEGKGDVERVNVSEPDRGAPLSGAQGLVWAFDSLWFHRNGGHLYRVSDTDGDDQLDKVETMPSERGGGEHGNHAVIVTEDGQALYLDGGNHANLAECATSAVPTWDEDLLLPRMWDANGHARGRLAPGGWVTRFDPKSRTQHLVCIGFRNEFDIALNRAGDLFTYDADMEWDMGSPWYRPTRICHVVSGGDFGWRSGTGKFPTYYEDSLPPVVDIGPGSPTGVVSGQGTKFPARYQDAIFALDWTYGTIYAIHLQPQGASYTGEIEHFVHASPLPVTDAIVGKDGALYFLVGGRGAQSAMFRVRYTGKESTIAKPAVEDPAIVAARKLRRELERFHGRQDAAAIAQAWPHLGSRDRFIRHAARIAVEAQPVSQWASRVYREADPQGRITGAVALARRGDKTHRAALLDSLLKLDPATLTEGQFLGLLRAYALNFIRLGRPAESERQAVIAELEGFLPAKSADLNTELIRVLTYLKAPGVIGKAMRLIVERGAPELPNWRELAERNAGYGGSVLRILDNPPPVRELAYAFMLRNLKTGWTPAQRREYFAFLNTAAQAAGGNSYPGFLTNIREEALANCSDSERKALEDLTGEDFNPVPDFPINPPQGPGREWTLAEAQRHARGPADFERGRSLFFAVGCGACHRLAGLGGAVGPDLTSIPHKFDQNYLLEAIINPSKDISDQYGSSVVTLKSGEQLTGLVIEHGNEIQLYPPDVKAEPTTISLADVKGIAQSPVSAMPAGLLNFLNVSELRDLVAYLMAGGNPKDRLYRR